jgi:hypothetical protein
MYIERALAAREDEEENWWQEIENFAYCLDGKAPEDWQELLRRVAAEPAPDPRGSLENFKRYAVCHLISVFAAGTVPSAETDAPGSRSIPSSIGQRLIAVVIIVDRRARIALQGLGKLARWVDWAPAALHTNQLEQAT